MLARTPRATTDGGTSENTVDGVADLNPWVVSSTVRVVEVSCLDVGKNSA